MNMLMFVTENTLIRFILFLNYIFPSLLLMLVLLYIVSALYFELSLIAMNKGTQMYPERVNNKYIHPTFAYGL